MSWPLLHVPLQSMAKGRKVCVHGLHSRAARPASGAGAGAEACTGLTTPQSMLGQRHRSAASARVA
eukprot:4524272-Alexandrium_andersonii.AAC.1